MDDTTTTVEAPSTTTTSTPSAPETSAAEPTVTTDRPSIKTALDVFNEAAKQQGRKTRGKPEAAISQPEGATTPPEIPAVEPPPTTKPGFVPTADHIKAVDNARTKARAEAEQQFRTTYGDPQQISELRNWAQRAATDRIGFMTDVINEALADPTLGPQVLSLVGRTLNGSRGSTTPSDQPPGPDFTDGQGHQFYSAAAQQARDEWLANKVKAEILGEVQPDLEQVRADREAQQIQREQQQRNGQITTGIQYAQKTWPYFDRFKAEIHAAVQAMPLSDGHPASEMEVLRRAYDQVVLPKLSELESARVVKDLQSRAHASTLNPAATGAATGIPKNVTAKTGGSFAEALKWAASQTQGR